MSIADKLTTVAENVPKVYEAGKKSVPDYLSLYINQTLEEYSDPNYNGTKTYAFTECYRLKKVDFPNATETGYYGFSGCRLLNVVNMPRLTKVGTSGFNACSALTKVDFPLLESIGTGGFNNSGICMLILRNENIMCTLTNISAFTSTPIANGTGYIYVPRVFLSDTDSTKDYRSATNWSAYATQFRALEDYTVDGTVTGEIDENKI